MRVPSVIQLLLSLTLALAHLSAAPTFQRKTVFRAGDHGVHSFRIPSMVTANDGSLLLFCEARKKTWRDKSPTDLVYKRSQDGGRQWSGMKTLKSVGNNACMDPLAVVDRKSGRVFVFWCEWPAKDHSGRKNRGWMAYSDDHGVTWSTPRDVTKEILPRKAVLNGFGPGAGLQMRDGSPFAGRLVIPLRLVVNGKRQLRALWSDDHGKSWKSGEPIGGFGEFDIAEAPGAILVSNRRSAGKRHVAYSRDGGQTWTRPEVDKRLPTTPGGCQATVFGGKDYLLYSSPKGGPKEGEFDDRMGLTLLRSFDGGKSWPDSLELYSKASGYSTISRLKSGHFAIAFESAKTPAFTRRPDRGADWMRLDLIILPPSTATRPESR